MRDYALHVAAFGADEAASDLELFLVGDLDVVPARVLSLIVTALVCCLQIV